jgi:hypothetical protein
LTVASLLAGASLLLASSGIPGLLLRRRKKLCEWAPSLLAGSTVIVTMAREGVLFLVALETMALFAYFLGTTEGTPDPFDARLYAPAFSAWADRLSQFRWLQQGRVGIYLLYILVTLVGLFAWSAVRERWEG